jgi:hypothetical protein
MDAWTAEIIDQTTTLRRPACHVGELQRCLFARNRGNRPLQLLSSVLSGEHLLEAK